MVFPSNTKQMVATLAPIITTQLVSKGSLSWSNYYFVTLGLSVLSIFGLGFAFSKEHSTDPSASDGSRHHAQRGKLKIALQNSVTLVAAIFISLYRGSKVTLGGWLFTFMIQVLLLMFSADIRSVKEPLDNGIHGNGIFGREL